MRDITPLYYKELWDSVIFLSDREKYIKQNADKIMENKDKYKKVATDIGLSFPWVVVGLIHMMESSFNFDKNLHNGESWNKKTVFVPKGRGPFLSWEEAAVDALCLKTSIMPLVWTMDSIAFFLEQYNGLGYAKRNVNSPYLWSFSNHGVGVGKYIYDGTYSKEAVSDQCGAMVVLKYMAVNNYDELDENNSPIVIYKPKTFSFQAKAFQDFINSLNVLQNNLTCDGFAGDNTSNASKIVFGFYLYGDPRNKG
jgi:lysozyme family protein